LRNVLIEIEYDGSGFSGWQTQPGTRTVQGELTRALSVVCGEEVRLNGTSRTDAGVHAYGQAASFTGDFKIPAERIPVASNNLLDDIKIINARDMPPEFHARFNAKGKTYLYRIAVSEPGVTPDIFLRNYRWQIAAQNEIASDEKPKLLDAEKMRKAATALIGTHDFSSFRSSGGNPNANPVKTITDITIEEFAGFDTRGKSQTEYEIRITGDGFLYNMVRIIVGTLAEIGLNKRTSESIIETLAAKDRSFAGPTAPAAGLWLARIYFDKTKN
jgi:tRNA pseudouridine38-40 synthase